MDDEQLKKLKELIYEAVHESHQATAKAVSEFGERIFRKPQKTLIEKIKDNWVVIIFFVTLFVTIVSTWTGFTNADTLHNSRLNALEAKTSAIEGSNTQILSQLSQIQTDLMWIKSLFEKK